MLLGFISTTFATSKLPDSETIKARALSLDIRSIVINFKRLNYSNAIVKKSISSTVCTNFYNQIVDFENSKLNPWFNNSDYQTSIEVMSLNTMVDTALNLASACSYKSEVELLGFKMYSELFNRDEFFNRYVLDY